MSAQETWFVAFSGTRETLHPDERDLIRDVVLSWNRERTVLVTGGCTGVDAHVARVGIANGYRVHVVVPGLKNNPYLDPNWNTVATTYETVTDLNGYPNLYLARNHRMVELANDRLAGFPLYGEKHPRSRRSGTWQAIRLARKEGLIVSLNVLRDEATP